MKAILLLGTSLVSAQYIRRAVKRLGYYPIFLLKIEQYSGDPRRAIEDCEHYEADINSVHDIDRVIQQNNLLGKVIAITSFLDETLQNACMIAQKYKIAGPDSALLRLTDKTIVQSIIPEFSPPSLLFTTSGISEGKIKPFFDVHNSHNKFVLKPGISSGAVGVYIINKNITINEIMQYVQTSGINNADYHNWMIQPCVTGQLYSLEGFVYNRQVSYLGISRRTRKELTEISNEFPVDNELPLQLLKRCQRAVEALVYRSGFVNGYFHCEFIIDAESDISYLIDANMGRAAGAAIVQQIALTYAVDPLDVVTHIVDLGLFQNKHLPNFCYNYKNKKPTLSIYYCLAESAKVFNVVLPSALTSFHTQVADRGKVISEVGTNDNAWIGFLAGHRDILLSEIKQIMIDTDRGLVCPFYMLTEQL